VTLNTSYNWSFGQDVVNGVEHELSEGGLGRVGGLGDQNGAWSAMDLFRYSAANVHDYTDGRDGKTTYFSANGTTLSSSVGLSFNNEYSGGTNVNSGDTADFTELDVFGTGNTGETNTLSQTDLNIMNALGWDSALPQDVWVASGAGNWTTVNATDWETNEGDAYVPVIPQDAFIGTASTTAQVTVGSNETVNSIGTNTASTLIIADGITFTATEGEAANTGSDVLELVRQHDRGSRAGSHRCFCRLTVIFVTGCSDLREGHAGRAAAIVRATASAKTGSDLLELVGRQRDRGIEGRIERLLLRPDGDFRCWLFRLVRGSLLLLRPD
jgi:hypothetical protein